MKNTTYNQLTKVQALVLFKIFYCFYDKIFTRESLSKHFDNRTEGSLKTPLKDLLKYNLLNLINNKNQKEYILSQKGKDAFILINKLYICTGIISMQDRMIELLIILKENKDKELIIKELLLIFCKQRVIEDIDQNYYYGLIKELRNRFLVNTTMAMKRTNGLNISISSLGDLILSQCLELDKLLKNVKQ